MKLTGSIPVLSCTDIAAAGAFYQQALQFTIVNQRSDDNGLQWLHLQNKDIVIMLEAADAVSLQPYNGRSRLYLYSDDVDAFHHYLQAKGYAPETLKHTNYHTYEFDLYDSEGYRLTIGQRKVKE